MSLISNDIDAFSIALFSPCTTASKISVILYFCASSHYLLLDIDGV